MRILFMGTPDFAVPCLNALVADGHEIVGVFTQPDKPKGRGYALLPPPVKVAALEKGLEVFQPASLKKEEAEELIKRLNPELIAVVAYGKMLPKSIIDFPKFGCVNVHGSLLPKYRGAAPIQWAIIDGEEKTGITTMLMNEGIDTGDMLLTEETKISGSDTFGDLHDRLSKIGAELLVKTVTGLECGEIVPKKQDDSLSNYAKMITKETCKINWSKTAAEIHNLIRGLSPVPTAYTGIGEKKLKIFKSTVLKTDQFEGKSLSEKNVKHGEIVCADPLVVACGSGFVELLEVQLEGKKRMPAQDFLRGFKISVGDVLL